MFIKECQMCHRQFEALGNRAAYCPECKPKHVRERGIINKRESRRKKKMESNTKKPVVSIAEQDRKAKAVGLSYGQYGANMERWRNEPN